MLGACSTGFTTTAPALGCKIGGSCAQLRSFALGSTGPSVSVSLSLSALTCASVARVHLAPFFLLLRLAAVVPASVLGWSVRGACASVRVHGR